MDFFDLPLTRIPSFETIGRRLDAGEGPIQLSGAVESQKVHIMSRAGNAKTRLVVTYDELQARALLEDFRFFSKEVLFFPEKDLLFYQADIRSNDLIRERMTVYRRILESMEQDRELTVVTTVGALLNTLPPFENFDKKLIRLSEGGTAEIEALSKCLLSLGYEHVARVENPGEYAVHGGILDVFDLTEDRPFRIEFWDTEIDTIRVFQPETQVSSTRLSEITIFPATELFLSDGELEEGRERIRSEYDKQKKIFESPEKLEEAASLQALVREAEDEIGDRNLRGVLERFMPFFYQKRESILSYLPEKTLIFLEEPARMEEYGNALEAEFADSFEMRLSKGMALPSQAGILRPVREAMALLDRGRTLAVTGLDTKVTALHIRENLYMEAQSMISYQGNFQGLTADLKRFQDMKYSVVFLIPSGTRGSRMAEELREYGISAYYTEDRAEEVRPGTLRIVRGNLHRGYTYPSLKFVVLTEGDIFGTEKKKKRKAKFTSDGQKIRSFTELSPGDYVVHENYGIGVYQGIETITQEEVARDYLKISYGTSGTLYVPVTNLDVVQKYASADAKPPKISKLDSPEWKKTKSRVRAAVDEVADELVKLYAVRMNGQGFVYGPDTVWQKEFEEMFPFEETSDQLDAIEDTKKDMESGKIMDRLICGDVGFGKTEVALRAAFKAVQEGKQVAYLVPTTILAQQHYNTFVQRMQDFPVRVDLLSRFRTGKEQEKTVTDLKKGMVDILIGTHRILSKDVVFKDLGLLIIDEEQRFGVAHKEKIKQLKNSVDVLTLTATPIPRTLHMSMIGVRDMSVLEEPPTDRQAIQTYVMEYSEELVREAIRRELARGGQVYYVYNRVQDIDTVAAKVQEMVPDATVAYAHGKMSERELEKRMLSFIERETDVLVSTTIIETGLDIPNVNTIIIHDAERYGLSQLYQLRGRVGRSNRQAYAFIMYRKNRVPGEDAQKRLEAIRQFTELGSGIKIAMQDLEIRGAGAVLGNAQSGHMMLVGYDLYCKMLSEAVRKKKGDDTEEADVDTLLDIRADAYIPDEYITNENLKLEIYKRISFLETDEDRENLSEELLDRFGEVPRQVESLMKVAILRARARRLYLLEVKGGKNELRFKFSPTAKIENAGLPDLLISMNGAMRFVQGESPVLLWHPLNTKEVEKKNVIEVLSSVLSEMEKYLLPEKKEE